MSESFLSQRFCTLQNGQTCNYLEFMQSEQMRLQQAMQACTSGRQFSQWHSIQLRPGHSVTILTVVSMLLTSELCGLQS
ncbi:hypothetical protein FGO68_gene12583 [Halteria grandinella]|uniref:Uncharacterized protein n=1 Tax=Halteria grandinella TaxID=5974 RepID=A0A8J8SZC1_HALGN|nr:hypothetical protein FGO68_gene12583 [Halteria grandinella]